MELKDFIKETISAISNGIVESQKDLSDKGVIINPERMGTGKNGGKVLRVDGWRYVQDLEFEVNVSVDEETNVGGGAKIKVFGVGQIGGDAGAKSSSSVVNKLKFKVPVSFPTTPTPEQYKSNKGNYTIG